VTIEQDLGPGEPQNGNRHRELVRDYDIVPDPGEENDKGEVEASENRKDNVKSPKEASGEKIPMNFHLQSP